MSGPVFEFADLFAGCGGTSTGALRAIEARGAVARLVAVNHWPVAVATHARNHPGAHFCMDLSVAEPEDMVPGKRLDLLVASPECTHFSRARGGKPVSDQRRSGADWVLRWLERLDVRVLLIENVKEFMSWGDVDERGRPVSQKRGRQFLAWLAKLRALGYAVDYRILNAADYGDVTTRERFFLIARKDGRPIRWPTPTHSRNGTDDMFGVLPKWRAAREIIDWSDLGTSLLDRAKPLSPKTRLRIGRGLQRFGGQLAPLYIRLLDLPSDKEAELIARCSGGLAEPFVLGQQSDSAARSADQPVMTISTGGVLRLFSPTAEPFLDVYYQTGAADSVDAPLSTATTKPRHALVSPLIVPYGPRAEARSDAEPLPTVMTKDRLGLAAPLVVPFYGERPDGSERRCHAADEPLPTIPTEPRFGITSPIASVITPGFGEAKGQQPRVHALDEPVPTISAQGHLHLATATLEAIRAAVGTVDPRRLVVIDGVLHLLDIRFRMLKNEELAAAMGFPPDYEFTGTKSDITKQIGNAVCVNLAAALVGAILEPESVERLAS